MHKTLISFTGSEINPGDMVRREKVAGNTVVLEDIFYYGIAPLNISFLYICDTEGNVI